MTAPAVRRLQGQPERWRRAVDRAEAPVVVDRVGVLSDSPLAWAMADIGRALGSAAEELADLFTDPTLGRFSPDSVTPGFALSQYLKMSRPPAATDGDDPQETDRG